MRITAAKGFLRQVKKAKEGNILMWDWVDERWIVGDIDKIPISTPSPIVHIKIVRAI